MNEYLNVMRNNYANFSGRARRREFWMFSLINGLILIALELLMFASGGFSQGDSAPSPLFYIVLVLIIVYALAIMVPTLAVGVRRLHDADLSGWYMLLNLVPALSLIGIVLHCLDSKPGTNKWGANPKGLQAPAKAF
jgi:uncharacterized membrane protein YhaH (DUF805 family)